MEIFPHPSDNINKELKDDDGEIKFDLTNISIELKHEPTVKVYYVSNIDFFISCILLLSGKLVVLI